MLENLDLKQIYQEQGFILAVTGAFIVAATFKIAQILKQDISYMNVISGNHPYLISFTLLSSVFFFIFKFNTFYDVKVMQEPQDLIDLTPISMFGVGGLILGLSYGLELMNHTLFKIQSLQDILRFVLFINVSKYVRSFVELNEQMEAFQFIITFDYKTYNIIALAVTSVISLFFLGKKFFLGILLAIGIIVSQVFHRYKLFNRDFVVFLVLFNILLKLFRYGQRRQLIKPAVAQELKKDDSSAKKIDDDTKQKQQTQNTKQSHQEEQKKEEEKEKEVKESAISDLKLNSKQQKQSSLIRVLIASVLGGVGYGLCGIVPEYAILNVAVFSPQITLVYLITFFVGFTLMVAIMSIIEFDLAKQVDKQMLYEYKDHLKKKEEMRKQMKHPQQQQAPQ